MKVMSRKHYYCIININMSLLDSKGEIESILQPYKCPSAEWWLLWGPSQFWGKTVRIRGGHHVFTSCIYITVTWVLVQLNPGWPHQQSQFLATAYHPFSTSITMKKENISRSGQGRIFYGRLLFCCHRLPPQPLCHLPGNSQKNSSGSMALASLDLLLNPFNTVNAAWGFTHLLK